MKLLKVTPKEIISDLRETILLMPLHTELNELIDKALPLHWTRDPFDRLIVAEAIYYQAKLLTKDKLIRDNFDGAVW